MEVVNICCIQKLNFIEPCCYGTCWVKCRCGRAPAPVKVFSNVGKTPCGFISIMARGTSIGVILSLFCKIIIPYDFLNITSFRLAVSTISYCTSPLIMSNRNCFNFSSSEPFGDCCACLVR